MVKDKIPDKTINIGFLWPCDGLNENEYWKFLPENCSLLTVRYSAGSSSEELTHETLSQYATPGPLINATKLLDVVGPDAIVCGDHAASFILGAKREKELTDAIIRRMGCPAIFPSYAISSMLNEFKLKRISLASPYSHSITQKFKDYLEAKNIDIVSSTILGLINEEDINSFAPRDWFFFLKKFVQTAPEKPEVLVLAGGGVSFSTMIPSFEAITGIPIITVPGALTWQTFRSLGIKYSKRGVGRLLNETNQYDLKIFRTMQSVGTKNFSLVSNPPVFISGVNCRLTDEKFKSYLDFASGSGTTALGHNHAGLKKTLYDQLETGINHIGPHFQVPAQAQLYKELKKILPQDLSRFHPSVSGSEATEVAVKAAMHATKARRFIGFEGGYHGRTLGALSVSGEKGKNQVLGPFEPPTDIYEFPITTEIGYRVGQKIGNNSSKIAGIIIEPIQATAGLRVADKEGLRFICDTARKNKIPVIFDEVFTGFARTAKLFAFEYYNIVPDLLILGKSFAAGMPGALVAGTENILGQWESGTQSSTFQLNPLAASAGIYLIKTLTTGGFLKNIGKLSQIFNEILRPFKVVSEVNDVRGLGLFWAIEMKSPELAKKVRVTALSSGLLTWECGKTGNVIGLVPPLNISTEDIITGVKILDSAFKENDLE